LPLDRWPVPVRRLLAGACDVAGTLSLAALLFLAAGGSARTELLGLRVSLTHADRPLTVFLAALAGVLLFGLTDGLYAALARRRIPVLSRLGAAVHGLERGLRRGYLRSRANVALALVTLALTLGAAELAFRYLTPLLPHRLGNYLAFGYDDRPHGIFRFNPEMNMLLMRPHYEREMYFNGYRWHHKTDWMGFRNPTDRRSADVVLLGDSMIYGHGVEETSTIRHYLEQALGRPVANLGMQAAGIHQEYQVLKRFGVALGPRYVFLFFLVNDIFDLAAALTDRDMERLLALPVEDHTTPYFDRQPPYEPSMRLRDRWRELYVYRALEFLYYHLERPLARPAAAAEVGWDAPIFRKKPRYALAMRAHLRTLLKIQDLADRHGFRFVHVFIATGGAGDQEPVYRQMLAAFCREQGIAHYDLGDVMGRERADRAKLMLRGDGHFSDLGGRWVARLLAGYVESGGAALGG
jgi:lysophospholipase L1-like esterase